MGFDWKSARSSLAGIELLDAWLRLPTGKDQVHEVAFIVEHVSDGHPSQLEQKIMAADRENTHSRLALLREHVESGALTVEPLIGSGSEERQFSRITSQRRGPELTGREEQTIADALTIALSAKSCGSDALLLSFDVAGMNPGDATSDREWNLKSTRVRKAWGQAGERGAGVKIAQPGAGWLVHKAFGDTNNRGNGTDDVSPSNANHTARPDVTRAVNAVSSVMIAEFFEGVSGAAPGAELVNLPMSFGALETSRQLSVSSVDLAQSIRTALDRGCHICVLPSLDACPPILARSIEHAVANNMLIVVSAGSVGSDTPITQMEGTITVSGCDQADAPIESARRGDAVDVVAPARGVWCADPFDNDCALAPFEGTGLAAGQVAGIAALWLAHNGAAKVAGHCQDIGVTMHTLFLRCVQETARRPNGWDTDRDGCGVIDAQALMRLDPTTVTMRA